MVNEKIKQAVAILKEKDVDMWLTFARETSSTPDPVLDLILGTNCTWQSAFIITKEGRTVAIVGSLDAQNIKDHADYEIITYIDSIKEPLVNIFKEIDPKRIAINFSEGDVMSDGLSHGLYLNLTKYLEDTPYTERFESSAPVISAVRGRKSSAEIEKIKKAIDITLEIFDEVTGFVVAGHTEQDVHQFINERMDFRGLGPAWDPEQCPAVFTGPESAGAHAGPTNRKIEPGHIMNIDFGVRYEGYVSDLQRTWYFLRPDEQEAPDEVIRGFETIRDSIQAAAKALRPGVEGWKIDEVARSYIVERGYEEYPHALGHQVGRKAHDGAGLLCPKWDRYKDLPFLKVEAGQVYTIEPRLNVKGYGVATMEEIVVVTESGCEFLSKPQEKLILIH